MSTVTTRPMDHADIEPAVPLLRRCWHEMRAHRYGHQWHEATVRGRLDRFLNQSEWGFFVAERAGQLLGLAAGHVGAQLLDARAKDLTEAIWHADPLLPAFTRARVMVQLWGALERFGRKQRVEGLRCALPAHFPAGVRRWLERRAVPGEQTYYQRMNYGT